jgi:beta-lactamase class D
MNNMVKIWMAVLMVLVSCDGFCSDVTFLLMDVSKGKYVVEEGFPERLLSPASTFKIPLSLMGFQEKILKTPDLPVWKYKAEYTNILGVCLDAWKQDQTPATWIKYSAIWYSQLMTKALGEVKFKQYVDKFNYGNKDVSGDPGKNNGLTECWLGSSLKITPHQQVAFLTKLVKHDLGLSEETYKMTRDVLRVGPIGQDAILYGKTGTSYEMGADGQLDMNRQIGWYVGWIERGEQTCVFVAQISDKEKVEGVASIRAKAYAGQRLENFLNQ